MDKNPTGSATPGRTDRTPGRLHIIRGRLQDTLTM